MFAPAHETVAKRDYYDVLGLKQDASAAEVKKAYRRLAMALHPDRNPESGSEEKFKEVTEAYQVLSDPEKRQSYDQFGHEGVDMGGLGGFQDLNSVFESVFGDFLGSRRSAGHRTSARRGSDLQYQLELDLESAVTGTTVTVDLPIDRDCGECRGTGAAKGTAPETCPNCGGSGRMEMRQNFFLMQQTCPRCRGGGKVILNPCGGCRGTGRTQQPTKVEVKIPPGVDDGSRLRLRGRGEGGTRGGPAGDLYVAIHLREHEFFQRRSNDLFCDLPVSFAQAALGGQIEVDTLDGMISLNVPPETQTDSLLRIRGRGVPSLKSGRRGDLMCRVVVETPVKLTPKQKSLLEEFQSETDVASVTHLPKGSRWMDHIRSFFDRLTQA